MFGKESDSSLTSLSGLPWLIALILLIVSFFAKIPGGAKWAGLILLVVVVQVLLGMFSGELPQLAMLHGVNAFIMFGAALYAGRRVSLGAEVSAEAQRA